MNTFLRTLHLLPVVASVFFLAECSSRNPTRPVSDADTTLLCGAERLESYLPLIQGKEVAVVANPTSRIGDQHLVDRLLQEGVAIRTVFAPEHGFRGESGAGEAIRDGKDPATGVRVISLYGSKHRPAPEDLAGIGVVVFDIQDVGVRFYTYIATLQYVMEACADLSIPVIVLDRPNPNGHYIDGPVLDTALRSFVGRTPIPVVHGCTVGEYARMLVGEGWLQCASTCSLTVVPVKNYTHSTRYELPVRPSPNLPNMNAIRLYPSLCFFEGTRVSLGRGTPFPFEVWGYPDFPDTGFKFTPVSLPGVAKHPPYEDTLCFGRDLRKRMTTTLPEKLDLSFLAEAYKSYPEKDRFFVPFFDRLAGTKRLREQLSAGTDPENIRESWQKDLSDYKERRKRYLLYPDFE
ncbi:MAG: hypothetical protein RL021_477 [Bacteroidota bacterium]|jgi:uncharacterized protein YbbC (DUF1343 family)